MNDDDRLDLSALRRARAPERELWPQIEARLKPRRSRWAQAQFALAASLVAALAAVFTFALPRAPADEEAFAAVRDDSSRAIVEANIGLVRDAERELQAALRQHPESDSLRALLARTQSRQRELSALL